MPAEIPEKEPLEVTAGNTVVWTKDLSDWPASTYTLTYYLRGPASIDIVATQLTEVSDIHKISKSSLITALWVPGKYRWQSFASLGSTRYPVAEGEIVIHEDPASSKRTFETKSINLRILEKLEKTMEENAGRSAKAYQIEAAGRQFTFQTYEELIMAVEKFRAFVKQEEDAKKIMRGEGTGKNIFVRFNRVA